MSKRMKPSGAREIVIAWTVEGVRSGMAIGGGCGLLVGLLLGLLGGLWAVILLGVIGLIAGATIGGCSGLAVGLFDGLVLAVLRPVRWHAELIAGVATGVATGVPAMVLVSLSQAGPARGFWFLAAGLTTAIGVGRAVYLARRLPPGRAAPPPEPRS
jgi:hypothetical protein